LLTVTTPAPGDRGFKKEERDVPGTSEPTTFFCRVAICSQRVRDAPLASFSRQVFAVIALVAGRKFVCACNAVDVQSSAAATDIFVMLALEDITAPDMICVIYQQLFFDV
jgi:hypothetical protein